MYEKKNRETIKKIKQAQKKKTARDPHQVFLIPSKEFRMFFDTKPKSKESEKRYQKLIKKESLIFLVFFVIFAVTVLMTFDVLLALLAAFIYPIYIVIRLAVWKYRS